MIGRYLCLCIVGLGIATDVLADSSAATWNLEQAVATASPGAVVDVPDGKYRLPQLVIDKPITLRGQRNDRWAVELHTQLRITAPDVQLKDLTVCGTLSPRVEDRRGHGGKETLITAEKAHGLQIRNCIIRYGRNAALRLHNSNDVIT